MSSSHRTIHPSEAILHRDNEVVGPMRLPTKDPGKFVEEFNRRYHATGLEIRTRDDNTQVTNEETGRSS